MGVVLNILTVALGLGFVIFLHELGHFLLAKWNGVKVEKFSIGFGPTLFGFQRGETEYVLAAVPLGGFVKMLGEGPEDEASKSSDPRAFPNKSVGARMAIISAGVIMNVFLGLGCFVWAYGRGMTETPAVIGTVLPGSPAYEAGLRPGDEIVAIDDRTSDVNYEYLVLKVRLSGPGQRLHCKVRHAGQDAVSDIEIEPRRDEGVPYPTIGVLHSESLILPDPPYDRPAGVTEPSKEPADKLRAGDTVVAVGPEGQEPTPVSNINEFHQALARHRSTPLRVTIERRKEHPSQAADRVTATLPPNHFLDFGMRMATEPIVSIQRGSGAERAGFHVGDRILKVNDRDDFDPMRLPDLCYENAGKPVKFDVERQKAGQPAEVVTLTVTPDDSAPWSKPITPAQPLDIPGLGLAYRVRPRVLALRAGSPAERAGIKVGDVISSIAVPQPPDLKTKLQPIVFDDKRPDWAYAFGLLQRVPLGEVTLTVNGSTTPVKLKPEADPSWFNTPRGLAFEPLERKLPPMAPQAALQRGFHDTVDNILNLYTMLGSLFRGRVSPSTLGGPVLIARMAYRSADLGLTSFIHFLGMLSINLAVLNFLPIPPLDGGQMIFLAAEKVRGRPLPDSALIAGTYAGLALVACLMLFVLFQDVLREFTGF